MKRIILYISLVLAALTVGVSWYIPTVSNLYLYQSLLLTGSALIAVRTIRKKAISHVKYIIPLSVVGQFLALHQCVSIQPSKWEWFGNIPMPIVMLILFFLLSSTSMLITKETKTKERG